MNTIVEVLGGMSVACFILSLPGFVWRLPGWRIASRRALLAAVMCGLAVPLGLIGGYDQPGHFLYAYLHPDPYSWGDWGMLFIPLYMLGLLLYAWLCLRPLFESLANRAKPDGPVMRLFRMLAYGGYDDPGAIAASALLAALGALLVLLHAGMGLMQT